MYEKKWPTQMSQPYEQMSVKWVGKNTVCM